LAIGEGDGEGTGLGDAGDAVGEAMGVADGSTVAEGVGLTEPVTAGDAPPRLRDGPLQPAMINTIDSIEVTDRFLPASMARPLITGGARRSGS
jgi:hypothetical protein